MQVHKIHQLIKKKKKFIFLFFLAKTCFSVCLEFTIFIKVLHVFSLMFKIKDIFTGKMENLFQNFSLTNKLAFNGTAFS